MLMFVRGMTAAVLAFTLMLGTARRRAGRGHCGRAHAADVQTLAGADSFSVHAEKLFDAVLIAGPSI